MNLSLSTFIVHLTQSKSFYGRLVSSIERVAKPGLGTMAVGIRNGRPTMYYDPAFIKAIPFKAALFVIEHELLHLVLDHIPRYLELLAACPTDEARAKAAAVYNIAMDCAINTNLRKHEGFAEAEEYTREHIKKKKAEAFKAAHPDGPEPTEQDTDIHPKDGMCLPEKFGLDENSSFEIYQWKLMRDVQIIHVLLDLTGGSNHSMWVEADGDNGDTPMPGEGEGEGEGTGEGDTDGEGNKEGKGKGKGKGKSQGKGQGSGAGGGQGKGKGQGDKDPTRDMIFDGSTFKNMTADELSSLAHRIRESIKDKLRQVVRSMGSVGRGTLPGGFDEWLAEYLEEAIIPWWEIFATRAKMSRTSKWRRSVSLPNRALLALAEEDVKIIPTPGRVRDKAWRVWVMVDTSGSMSTESLEILLSELTHMLAIDESMEVRYMQGDATVNADVILHSGDEIPKNMVGRGGTDFDAYLIYMGQKIKDGDAPPDIVIVYTDGYAPAVAPKNRLPPEIPLIWLVTPQYSERFAENYGEIIVCDPAHNDKYKS